MKITDEQISFLKVDAGSHGDMELVRLCLKALGGNRKCRAECAKLFSLAQRMQEG